MEVEQVHHLTDLVLMVDLAVVLEWGLGGGSGAYPGSPTPIHFRMGYDGGTGTDNGVDNIAAAGGGGAGGAGKMELHQMVLAVMVVMDHIQRLQSKVQLLNFMPVVALVEVLW